MLKKKKIRSSLNPKIEIQSIEIQSKGRKLQVKIQLGSRIAMAVQVFFGFSSGEELIFQQAFEVYILGYRSHHK